MRIDSQQPSDDADCPLARSLRLLAGKWKPMILHMLSTRPQHFGAIVRQLPTASRKMVASQLRELITAGLLERHDVGDARRHVRYQLSRHGKSLTPILDQLYDWGSTLPEHAARAKQ